MAIIKKIELENGVVINYHRIASLNKITNISNNIEVSSYTNKTQRAKEQRYQELQTKENLTIEEQGELEKGINVFIETDFIQTPYEQNMSIEEAYNYLKTTEKYKEAEDN